MDLASGRRRGVSSGRERHFQLELERREARAQGTLAAVGFAGLLVVILRSEEVRGMLTAIVRQALSIPG